VAMLPGCLLLSLGSIGILSQHRWAGVGGAVSCLHYTPRLRHESLARCTLLMQQLSNLPCIGSSLLHMDRLLDQRRLFTVPDFPGNLAVFILGSSGMKMSRNLGRPGNGSQEMNSLSSCCHSCGCTSILHHHCGSYSV